MSSGVLCEYATVNRDHISSINNQNFIQNLQKQETTDLCSPVKRLSNVNLHLANANQVVSGNLFSGHSECIDNDDLVETNGNTGNTATDPYSNFTTVINSTTATNNTTTVRSTNPFLNAKFDSQSNSDSLSDRISLSGSTVRLDHLQNSTGDYGAGIENAFILSSVTATPNTCLSPKIRSSKKPLTNQTTINRSSIITSSSSGTSSKSNTTMPSDLRHPTTDGIESEAVGTFTKLPLGLREYNCNMAVVSNGGTSQSMAETNSLSLDVGNLSDSTEEPPPEPAPEPILMDTAPPEIPPRTQSLLMSLRKHSDYKLNYEEKGDQKHEEFIPTSQLQHQFALQQQSKSQQASAKGKKYQYFLIDFMMTE